MKFHAIALVLALSAVERVAAATCSSAKGTCKTSGCNPPAYYWNGGLTGCATGTACCVWQGCVVCKAGSAEEQDLERRVPCC